jgi:hypothetical protein
MFTELANTWSDISQFVIDSKFLNAPFVAGIFGAIPGALFGAWAGARAARKIAERTKLKVELSEELKNTNKAIVIAFSICNKLIGLKGQHVHRLKEEFDAAKLALEEAVRRGGRFEFIADLRTLTPDSFPVRALENLVFEKVSVGGRPLAMVSTLVSSVEGLQLVLTSRNDLVEKFKQSQRTSGKGVEKLYFGLPDESGHVDETYPDLVAALSSITDDCIYFSKTLGEDLGRHGKRMRERFITKFGEVPPRVSEANFEKSEKRGLLPPVENYTDWETGFMEIAPGPTRWQRLYRYLHGVLGLSKD